MSLGEMALRLPKMFRIELDASFEAEDVDPPPNCKYCRTPVWPDESVPGHRWC